MKTFGAKPALLGYKPSFSAVPYLHATCISVNNEVIHGVPKKRILTTGDLVSLDMTASVDGWCADSTITTAVGPISDKARRLMLVTREAMYRGIEQARIGRTTGDIGYAIQRHVEKHGMNVVREMVGHGIGRTPHESGLDVPNYGKPRKGIPLQIGMTFCIEPMVMLGASKIEHADEWTIVTSDGSWAAHWEHTVAVTKDGPVILTSPPREDPAENATLATSDEVSLIS